MRDASRLFDALGSVPTDDEPVNFGGGGGISIFLDLLMLRLVKKAIRVHLVRVFVTLYN